MSTQREIKVRRLYEFGQNGAPENKRKWIEGELTDEGFKKSGFACWHRPLSPWVQYTGLRDKEGHEVYDGDLPGGIWEEHRVQWCHKCHGWSLGLVEVEGHCGQCDGDYMWRDFVDDVNEGKTTIIGNIHEHPSLIP